jgi:hypothetical protein
MGGGMHGWSGAGRRLAPEALSDEQRDQDDDRNGDAKQPEQ